MVSVTALTGSPFVSLTCPEILKVGIGGLELGAHEGARAPLRLLVTFILFVPSIFAVKTIPLKGETVSNWINANLEPSGDQAGQELNARALTLTRFVPSRLMI